MPAVYRLRLTETISTTGSTYGSAAKYGDGVYGQRSSDANNLLHYFAVPVSDNGHVQVRVGDQLPAGIEFQILGVTGLPDLEDPVADLAVQVIEVRAGDDYPSFTGIVEDSNRQPLNLSGATVYLRVRHPDGTVTELLAVLADGPSAAVVYDWSGAQTRTWGIGDHELSIRADWSNGDQVTTADRNCVLRIRPEVALSEEPLLDEDGLPLTDENNGWLYGEDIVTA